MSDAIPPYPQQIQDPTVPTQVLAVDSSGRLTANQGIASALSGWWPVKITDGTNVLPTADVAARALYSKVTDGTNVMPTGDVAARAVFHKITDGTNTATVGTLTTSGIGVNTVNLGIYRVTPPTLTDGQVYPFRVDSTGAMVVSATLTSSTVNQGTPAAIANAWPVKVTDGTSIATVGKLDTTGVGTNTVPLGVYRVAPATLTDGQVSPLQLDSQGRLITTASASVRRTIELSFINSSFAAYVGNMWRNVLLYAVPASYQLEITEMNSLAGNLLSSSRVTRMRILGTFNVGTSVYTDGGAYAAPGFCSSVEGEVTTALTGTAVTLTVTYTNQDGVAGRTGTIACTAAAPLGYRFLMALQAGDYGVRDVVVITKSGGTAGVVTVYGITTLVHERNTEADMTYLRTFSRESIIVEAGDLVSLEITSTGTTATNRLVKTLGILSPV